MPEIKDPMELSPEEYEAEQQRLLSLGDEVTEETTEEVSEETIEYVEGTTEVPEETVEADIEETTEEVVEDVKEERLYDIQYKGQTKRLTEAEMTALAQKGFSYNSDMNKIREKKKIVTLIEADPEIGNLVDNYIKEKANPKIQKLDNFDTEEDWLQANITASQESAKYKEIQQKVQDPTPPGAKEGTAVVNHLAERDPEHHKVVLSSMGKYASKLTKAQYDRVNTSVEALEEFYDAVKVEVLKGNPPQPIKTKPKPSFRIKSGGGTPPRQAKTEPKAWEMSSKDFNEVLRKAKGY